MGRQNPDASYSIFPESSPDLSEDQYIFSFIVFNYFISTAKVKFFSCFYCFSVQIFSMSVVSGSQRLYMPHLKGIFLQESTFWVPNNWYTIVLLECTQLKALQVSWYWFRNTDAIDTLHDFLILFSFFLLIKGLEPKGDWKIKGRGSYSHYINL